MSQMAQRNGVADVVALMGGAKALDRPIRTNQDLADAIAAGLYVEALRNTISALETPEKTIVEGVGLSRSTLSRRKATGRLDVSESERAVRLARIAVLGKAVLGSTAAAGRWLLKPNRALGGRIPLSLLQSDVGSREVEAILGRALYGGYS